MRKITELPERWQEKVDAYLNRTESQYKHLSLADFSNKIRITFEDGSCSQFLNAFYLVDNVSNELAIFTEHCGYHVFPFCIERIETLDHDDEILKIESFVID